MTVETKAGGVTIGPPPNAPAAPPKRKPEATEMPATVSAPTMTVLSLMHNLFSGSSTQSTVGEIEQ